MRPRPKQKSGFTLVEVLIALALSAAIFTAALNLLLGVVTAWERAREGDLTADEDFRLFAYLKYYLETAEEDNLRIQPLPGERSEYWLTFPVQGSPFTEVNAAEWQSEQFALVKDRDGIRLVPVVESGRDEPKRDDGLLLMGGDIELEYWTWNELREQWEDSDRLESQGGQDPAPPGYLILRLPDESQRWIRVGISGGDIPLW